MDEFQTRLARPDDAEGVNGVYNPFIRKTAITFETAEYSTDDRRAWLEDHAGEDRYPVFVAVDGGGTVRGFASASAFDVRAAYETSVKTSVFIDPAFKGRGLGGRLYRALFDALEGVDLHRAYALIVTPNPASVALHESFGFRHLATLSEVGRKFGRFHDVAWFEKAL